MFRHRHQGYVTVSSFGLNEAILPETCDLLHSRIYCGRQRAGATMLPNVALNTR
ncbi:hypothetical protein HMPREF0208_04961 [Citrobacter koseri]|nr:hypothetical protein HMPREF0208_04961 [Citrobacter koseri]